MVTELAGRFAALVGDEGQDGRRLTLVFDAGQNSEDNYDLLDSSAVPFRRLAPPSDHPDLLAVGKDRYRPVDDQRFPGLRRLRDQKVVFGTAAPSS
jgi:hypothetical protein